jgi:hypothetical protein
LNFFDKLQTKLQEQNSSRFNSQKENMMQAANVKQATKLNQANIAINQALTQKTESAKVKNANVVELTKSQSFNRFLEAYSDCV